LFKIGYLDRLLPEGVPSDFLKWSQDGLKLSDVFVLPLTNILGEIKGFQFRSVDRKRSGYMDYFLDRREAILFGLGQAAPHIWKSRSVFLVEGGFDLFPIQRAFPAVVATLTARTSIQSVRLFRRLVTKVWMGYDMDPPGRKGCEAFKSEHGSEFEVYTVQYPKVGGVQIKDPGDLWEAWGDVQMIPFIKSVVAEDLFV
jgi:DNA primase